MRQRIKCRDCDTFFSFVMWKFATFQQRNSIRVWKNSIDILEKIYGANKSIFMEDIRATFPGKTRQTLYRWIERAIEDRTLVCFDRGVYYLPRKTRFGQSRLPSQQVVRRKWIERDGEVIGYVSGAGLANSVGVTDQAPATLNLPFNRKIESKLDGLRVFFIHNLLPSFKCPACSRSVQTAIAINPKQRKSNSGKNF